MRYECEVFFNASCTVEIQEWKNELCLKTVKWSLIGEVPLLCFDYLHVNYINMRQAWASILHQNQIPLGDAHAIAFQLCFAVFAFYIPLCRTGKIQGGAILDYFSLL